MSHITEEQKWEIISTWKRGNSIRATAIACEVKESTAARWIGRYNATSGVKAKASTGRPRALDSSGDKAAHDLLLSGEHGGAAGVAQAMQDQGITETKLCCNTIIQAAKRAGNAQGKPIRCYRGKPAKRLTAASKLKRLAFAKANKGRCWNNVMFTDRKKFNFFYPGAKVRLCCWLSKGQKPTASAVNHAQTVNVYVGITKFGVTRCHIVAGTSKHKTTYRNKKGDLAKNITSEEHQVVVKTTFLPEGQRMCSSQGISTWVLQQDNDPSHNETQAVISKWNQDKGSSISLLPNWPPNSPDLNPMENIWAWVDQKVNALGCATFDQYQQAVLETFQIIPQAHISRLYNSMPKRMADVISLEGDKTKY